MPSSTSNFETRFARDRIPKNVLPSVWVQGLLLSAVVLCGAETYWRSAGHRPSVVDSLNLWSYHRSEASAGNPKTLVLCGSSRTLLGFSSKAFRTRHPDWKVVQLAVDGRAPQATLEDIAADPGFHGVLLLEIHESAVGYSQGQNEHVKFHHTHPGLTNSIECLCCAAIQNAFVVVQPALNPKKILGDWIWRQQLPQPSYRQGYFDRCIDADYQRLDAVSHREWRLNRVRSSYERWGAPTPEGWKEKATPLVTAAEAIRKRGGKVVFVRYPTSDEYWELDCHHYPRSKYWDALVAENKLLAVHFQDLPVSRSLKCPDTSHLDTRDKELFTNELIDFLQKDLQLFPGNANGTNVMASR